MSASNTPHTGVLRDKNGKVDSASLPEATDSTVGAVKASTSKAPNTVVKADSKGSLDGWRKALSEILVDNNLGIVVDKTTGKLAVDFSQMSTNKFEALLKALKMQIPLESNLNLYVDNTNPNADDTVIKGRGTQEKPFKTISACVGFVTQTYALGKYSVSIFISPSTYTENIVLPAYNTTSGSITLKALDSDNPPTIVNEIKTTSTIRVSGGLWSLVRLKVFSTVMSPGNNIPYYVALLRCETSSSVNIYGCSLSIQYEGTPHSGVFYIRLISSDTSGNVNIVPLAGYQTTLKCLMNNASGATFLHAERQGNIKIYGGNTPDDGICYTIPCSGNASYFAVAANNSNILKFFEGLYTTKLTGSVTAKRYSVTSGSGIHAPDGGFPGNEEGYAEASTFGWYSQ